MEKNEEKKKKALDEDKLDEVNGGRPFLVNLTDKPSWKHNETRM